jgi:uncharacterized protein
MAIEQLLLIMVIAVFSVVQSLFGMGILVFGTPTLILMGYDFITTLSYLLPASFAISLLQVLTAASNRVPVSKHLYLFCLPGIGVGLFLAGTSIQASWTNVWIGGTLIISALVRFWPPLRVIFSVILEKNSPAYHLIMGLVHGLTNLGGALLAILASGTSSEKEAIRYTVAHYYLVFSIVQMLFLATMMEHLAILIAHVSTAAISATVYILIGNRIFLRASNPAYNLVLTMFMAIYGAFILLKL